MLPTAAQKGKAKRTAYMIGLGVYSARLSYGVPQRIIREIPPKATVKLKY